MPHASLAQERLGVIPAAAGATTNSYDLVPYESGPFQFSHPNCTGAIATLAGVAAPLPSTARVLELGCASGGNLIPMAQQFPDGRYLGIDHSARQIADGRAQLDVLRLTNIELRHASILDVTPEFGEFDYIIAHGVYSWVPPEVQDKLLRICRENLASPGVAFVSYNTLPGWHAKRMLREMMLYHVRSIAKPEDKIAQARTFLQVVVQHLSNPGSPYAVSLRQQIEQLTRVRDDYLFHEYLECDNRPVYFYEFAELAQAAGLRYVAESPVPSTAGERKFVAPMDSALREWSAEQVQREQYIDFLDERMFRQSLLTRHEENVALTHTGSIPESLRLAGTFVEEPTADGKAIAFRAQSGAVLCNPAPPVRAALRHLTAIWPQSCTFAELTDVALKDSVATVSTPKKATIAALRMMLGGNSLRGDIQFTVEPWPFLRQPRELPRATPLARLQAANKRPVTSQAHTKIALDAASARILELCDGERTEACIADAFASGIIAEGGALEVNGEQITDVGMVRAAAGDFVARSIRKLASDALIV